MSYPIRELYKESRTVVLVNIVAYTQRLGAHGNSLRCLRASHGRAPTYHVITTLIEVLARRGSSRTHVWFRAHEAISAGWVGC